MARDAFPWKRHMMTPHNWRRAVEGWTVNHYLKSAALSMSVGVMTSSCSITQVFIVELTSSVEIKGLHCSEWQINLLHVNVLWKNDNRYLWNFKTGSMSRKLSIWSVMFSYLYHEKLTNLMVNDLSPCQRHLKNCPVDVFTAGLLAHMWSLSTFWTFS